MLAIQAIWRSLKGATSSVGGKSADPPGVDFSPIVTDRLKRRRQRKMYVGGVRPTRMHVCTTHAPRPLYMPPSSRWCLSHAPCRLTAFNYLKLHVSVYWAFAAGCLPLGCLTTARDSTPLFIFSCTFTSPYAVLFTSKSTVWFSFGFKAPISLYHTDDEGMVLSVK